MEFATPLALALAALAVPIGLSFLAKPRRAVPLPSLAGLGDVPATARQRVAKWLPLLHVVVIMLLAVSLARPRVGNAKAVTTRDGLDIALVLDTSSSMELNALGTASRLDVAKQVLLAFLSSRENDRIGVVVFQSFALTLAPLTLDHGALAQALSSVDSSLIPDGTGIGVGIAEALNLLRESPAVSRIVILLTDGNHNTKSITPEDAASLAAAMNIRVYTVGIVPEQSRGVAQGEFDEERLRVIAEKTGARYFPARSEADLVAVYDEIGRLETSRIRRQEFLDYREFGPWFAFAAAVLVIAEVAAKATVLRRVPG